MLQVVGYLLRVSACSGRHASVAHEDMELDYPEADESASESDADEDGGLSGEEQPLEAGDVEVIDVLESSQEVQKVAPSTGIDKTVMSEVARALAKVLDTTRPASSSTVHQGADVTPPPRAPAFKHGDIHLGAAKGLPEEAWQHIDKMWVWA
jgi:hypothetical protein